MLKYVLQELPEWREGQQSVYPKLLVYSQIGNEKIVDAFQKYEQMQPGHVTGVLCALPDILQRFLTEGHTVKIEGLGTFSLSLEFDDEKPTEITGKGEEKGYRRVRVKNINFNPDRKFLRSIQDEAEAERAESDVRRVKTSPYTREERLQRALNHLQTHSFITLSEYANLNGLKRTAASLELNSLAEDPASGIKANGAAPHKVWVKRK
jgi:predicted histone-like DNA-binding protein